MTNRLHLIREGINDAYSEVFQTPWERITFHNLTDRISGTLPDRWGLKNPALLRACARAYAMAEFSDNPNRYRKDGFTDD